MRCGTSFFNASVYKSCLKRYWPVWALLLLTLVLSLPLPVMNAGRDALEIADIVRTVGGYGSVVTTFVYSIMAAVTVFSWMFQAKSAGFTGALPLKREAMFLSCALAGFTMLAFPAAVTAFLLLLTAAGSCGFVGALAIVGQWLGKFLLLSLCFFGFSCLCAQLTGAIWVHPAVYILLNVAVAGFWVLIANVLRLLLPGFGGGLPMLAADLSPIVRMFLYEWYDPCFDGWAGLGAYALFGLVCAFLGLVLAKKRKLETATDTVALGWLKPVFRWVFSIGFALCFANLVYLILLGEERFHYAAMGVLLVLGGFLGWIIAEMLVRKSFKVRSCLKTYPILAALLVLLVIFCASGGLGYSAYCPPVEQVRQASLFLYSNSCVTDDPAAIGEICAIHRDMAASRAGGDSYSSVQVIYYLNDGGLVTRSFPLESLSEEGKRVCRELFEGQLRGSLEKMLTEPDLILNIDADYSSDETEGWFNFMLEDEDSRALVRCLLADAAAGDLRLFSAWYLGDSTVAPEEYYELRIQSWRKRSSEEAKGPGAWDDPYDGGYWPVSVTPAARNTWEMLEHCRLLEERWSAEEQARTTPGVG